MATSGAQNQKLPLNISKQYINLKTFSNLNHFLGEIRNKFHYFEKNLGINFIIMRKNFGIIFTIS